MTDKLKAILAGLKKRFLFANAQGFLYNKASDLQKKSDTIGILVLLYDEDTGFKKHTYIFKRRKWNYKIWYKFIHADKHDSGDFTADGESIMYEGGLKIITDHILPSRNDLLDENLKLVSIIGWSFNLLDSEKTDNYH